MKLKLLISTAVAAAALAVAGCGGGGAGGSGADPASVAPAGTPVYVEIAVQPEGEMSSNIDALAKNIAGVDNVGELIVTELEKSANDSGEPVDFAKEIEPWLGEKGGIFLPHYDGGSFNGYGVAVQTTDAGAAQEFIDKHVGTSGSPAKDGSFEGVDYEVETDNGQTIGMIGDLLVFSQDEKSFKEAIEASGGESLAEQEAFTDTIDTASGDSVAKVFVDIGGLIKQAGSQIDAETELFLEASGIEPKNATAVASLLPGSDQVEIDLASNVGSKPPSGDASKLLGSLPGGSFAAFSSADFGSRFAEAITRLDAEGIPGSLEPGELETALGALGIDIKKLGASIGEVGVFAQGNTKKNLTGALVLNTAGSKEATETVAQVGKLLRVTGTPGVTAISGKASGFSVRSPSLGQQPLVVAAEGDRIAISYGLAASAQALTAGEGATLAKDPAYEEAVAALGDTPITGFLDGPAALQFFTDVAASSDQSEGFEEAKPYLEKIAFIAFGAGSEGELSTARVIVGFSE
jgi:hypothetical protein